MTLSLIAGANAPLSQPSITIHIQSQGAVDCAAYRLTAQGRVRGDGDMVFYGQRFSDDGTVQFEGDEHQCQFVVDLAGQPSSIERIALAFAAEQPLGQLGNVGLTVLEAEQPVITAEVVAQGRSEKALILAECYRHQGRWKFRFIDQGFNGGLKPLSEHFGVEIADEASPGTPVAAPAANPPPAAPRVNLSKIVLTKTESSINLRKQDSFGNIAVNLNWSRQQPARGGFLSGLLGGGQGGVDLDLGAFVALRNGRKTVVQALGDTFGHLQDAPFVRLRADDRTGDRKEGEWLDINGQHWAEISEVLIYAFIYRGVPNWQQTDALICIQVPDQPLIETRLSEGNNRMGMCAIARLINREGGIQIERLDRYFGGHRELDQAYGWGFNWSRGSKS